MSIYLSYHCLYLSTVLSTGTILVIVSDRVTLKKDEQKEGVAHGEVGLRKD
jgi:hypothetical protein